MAKLLFCIWIKHCYIIYFNANCRATELLPRISEHIWEQGVFPKTSRQLQGFWLLGLMNNGTICIQLFNICIPQYSYQDFIERYNLHEIIKMHQHPHYFIIAHTTQPYKECICNCNMVKLPKYNLQSSPSLKHYPHLYTNLKRNTSIEIDQTIQKLNTPDSFTFLFLLFFFFLFPSTLDPEECTV